MAQFSYSKDLISGLENLALAENEADVWQAVTNYLHSLDIGEFNYGYLDTFNYSIDDAPLALKSTMDPTWIDYYFEKKFDFCDHIMNEYRTGRKTPILSGPNLSDYVPEISGETLEAFNCAADAGVLAAASVPLPAPMNSDLEVMGICLVSQLSGDQFLKVFSERGFELMLFLNAMHDRMIGPLIQKTLKEPALTERERECLTFAALGFRPEQIADRLTLATVTVNVHLRTARSKMKAQTLAEAVARSIRFGLIAP